MKMANLKEMLRLLIYLIEQLHPLLTVRHEHTAELQSRWKYGGA